MMQPSNSKTFTAKWRSASRSTRRFSTAPRKLPCRRSFRRSALASCLLVPFLGQNFFPAVDAGEIRLHARAPTGTRIEQTAKLVDEVEAAIRREIPAAELAGILDNTGLPVSGINLSYNDSGISGP